MKEDDIKRRLEELFVVSPGITFIKFFGGEPTLRMDLIERVCRFVTTELGHHVHFAVTTNGTLDARRHIDIWKEFRVSVSVSIDGPEQVHDSVRVRSNGQGSFRSAVRYCEVLRDAGFPLAVVGVFDERHINIGLSYLQTIRFLNSFSPLVKVQFVEALGDSATRGERFAEILGGVRQQVFEAVDAIFSLSLRTWARPSDENWIYDNNLYRFLYGLLDGRAVPYEHACTASHLTTLFPSGALMPCYTFSELPELGLGGRADSIELVQARAREFRQTHSWTHLEREGVSVPWYRGVVGDVCVADMLNGGGGKESSPFYREFQESAVLRVLQHLAAASQDRNRFAQILFGAEMHRLLTSDWTALQELGT